MPKDTKAKPLQTLKRVTVHSASRNTDLFKDEGFVITLASITGRLLTFTELVQLNAHLNRRRYNGENLSAELQELERITFGVRDMKHALLRLFQVGRWSATVSVTNINSRKQGIKFSKELTRYLDNTEMIPELNTQVAQLRAIAHDALQLAEADAPVSMYLAATSPDAVDRLQAGYEMYTNLAAKIKEDVVQAMKDCTYPVSRVLPDSKLF